MAHGSWERAGDTSPACCQPIAERSGDTEKMEGYTKYDAEVQHLVSHFVDQPRMQTIVQVRLSVAFIALFEATCTVQTMICIYKQRIDAVLEPAIVYTVGRALRTSRSPLTAEERANLQYAQETITMARVVHGNRVLRILQVGTLVSGQKTAAQNSCTAPE